MGIHRGPNPVNDGLTFGYDTGYGVADNTTPTRFYPGQPATNNTILAGYAWAGDGGNQSFANKGATAITDNSLKYNGYDTVLWTPGGSLNCYLNSTPDLNYSDSSTVWTFSCYVKREDGAPITSLNVYMYYPNSDGNAAGTIVDCGNGWYRVSRTRTGSSSYIGLAGFTGFVSGNKYYLSGVMLSKTSHTVPYVAVQSSRSSTASLIDLKRTTSIDVSNVSFDSNGQPTFDNTDDRITMPNSSVFNHTSELSIEAWVKFDGNSADFIFEKGNVNTQYSLFSHGTDIVFRTIHAGDSGYQTLSPSKTTAGITNGVWHHIVGSWDGSTKRIYVDGVDKASVSKSGALTTTSAGAAIGSFGGTSSGYYFGGDIAVVKIYDKGLSAAEVLQNYNAYKNRFKI